MSAIVLLEIRVQPNRQILKGYPRGEEGDKEALVLLELGLAEVAQPAV